MIITPTVNNYCDRLVWLSYRAIRVDMTVMTRHLVTLIFYPGGIRFENDKRIVKICPNHFSYKLTFL